MAWSPDKMRRLLEDLIALDPETASLDDFEALRQRAIEARDTDGRQDSCAIARSVMVKNRKERAKTFDAYAYPIIRRMRYEDRLSIRQIADALNAKGVLSPTGRGWCYSSVSMIFHRNGDKSAA